MEGRRIQISDSVRLYGPTSSAVVLLKDVVPQTSWKGAGKDRITLLGEATPSFVKPPKRDAESKFEGLSGSKETRKCFLW